jgi:ABC-type uncharacterized transport system permease subunit
MVEEVGGMLLASWPSPWCSRPLWWSIQVRFYQMTKHVSIGSWLNGVMLVFIGGNQIAQGIEIHLFALKKSALGLAFVASSKLADHQPKRKDRLQEPSAEKTVTTTSRTHCHPIDQNEKD